MKASLQTHRVTVDRITERSPTVREFTLRPDDGAEMAYAPGSHLPVEVPVGERRTVPRHYSLVGLPGDGVWRIAVKHLPGGRGGSRAMWRLEEGARLRVGTPASHFALDHRARDVLLLAGGIGVTPLVGMAQALAERAALRGGVRVRMLQVARVAEELVFADTLAEALGDRLRTVVTGAGQTLDLAAEIAALPANAQCYVCGPAGLMQHARQVWREAGRPAVHLRFETFGTSGEHPAQAFTVKLPRHGLTLDVPPDSTLLEVLERAGVEVLADCRRGECGLCAVDVLAVESGVLDHRDVFLSPGQRAENRQICACVSRVASGASGTPACIVLDSSYRPD
jgi:ferredoxin-NADP reductase